MADSVLAPVDSHHRAERPPREAQGPDGAVHRERPVLVRAVAFVGVAFDTVLVMLVALLFTAGIASMTGHAHYEVVESGSMRPTLQVGGVSVLLPEPIQDVHVGQVVALHPPGQPHYLRLHRIVALFKRGPETWITTKGDANNVKDPGPIRLLGSNVWVERWSFPYLGYLELWLSRHSVRILLYGLLFMILGWGVWRIWATPKADAGSATPAPRQGRGPRSGLMGRALRRRGPGVA